MAFRQTGQAGSVSFTSGFHPEEFDGNDRFRWMRRQGTLTLPPAKAPRYVAFHALSEFCDLTQHLELEAGGNRAAFTLTGGWNALSAEVPPGADLLTLTADRTLPPAFAPADARELAVRVRDLSIHGDPRRHEAALRRHANNILNQQEMTAGAPVLESRAPNLGIDFHGVCNISPPCVFCEWDAMKAQEGENADRPFTPDTFRGYGDFFLQAGHLVNCSIGEPFLMRNLGELLDVIGEQGQTLEMATNGQILTDRILDSLLGRDIRLFFSIDAATAKTYAKLRNRNFEVIIRNVRRLTAAKGGRAGLPRVFMVFMPMRANIGELDDFIRLCADLEVDQLILRPLNETPAVALQWERSGYRFDYQKELLPFETLIRLSGRAHELCRRLGLPLSNQLDFGRPTREMFNRLFEQGRAEVTGGAGEQPPGESGPLPAAGAENGSPPPAPPVVTEADKGGGVEVDKAGGIEAGANAGDEAAVAGGDKAVANSGDEAADAPADLTLGRRRWPVCVEPWRSYYILRRGILPCCYGMGPIAPMDDFREAWNGPLLQAIRAELARGRFHDYCLRSTACPIVRKQAEARDLPPLQAMVKRLRRAWGWLNRRTGEVPRKLLRPIKRSLGGAPVMIAVLAAAPAFLAPAGCAHPAGGEVDRPPNLLLITVDTLRADYLRCYGHPAVKTPYIDRLAASGVRFARNVAPSQCTNPSHASILTGLYPAEHGVYDNTTTLAGEAVTLAEILAGAGYRTIGAVSADHLNRDNAGFDQGFDTFLDCRGIELTAVERNRRLFREIREAADEPFFVWVHYFDPHGNYMPPVPYSGMYRVGDDYAAVPPREWMNLSDTQKSGPVDPDEIIPLYMGEITFLDSEVGRLLGLLEDLALADRTLVVLVADHGESMTEKGIYFCHAGLYNQVQHVPLILRFPGRLPAGRVVQSLTSSVDVLPTVLDLLDVEAPSENISGVSLVRAIGDPGTEPHDIIYSEAVGGVIRAVYQDGYKFIKSYPGKDWSVTEDHLYRPFEDYPEEEDLIAAEPDRAALMARELDGWLEGAEEKVLPSRKREELDPQTEEALRHLGYIE